MLWQCFRLFYVFLYPPSPHLTPLCRSPSRALPISGFTSRTTRGTRTTWAESRSGSISSTAEPRGNTSRSWGRKSTPTEMMGASMVWENSCASHLTLERVWYNSTRNHQHLPRRFWCLLGFYITPFPLFGGGFPRSVFGLGRVDGRWNFWRPSNTGLSGCKHYEITDLAMDICCGIWVSRASPLSLSW